MQDNTKPLSPVKRARRDRIVVAAERLFAELGFRATTMEGVAAAVAMSKVTVYGYFRDKDALFQAVAAGVADRMRTCVATALASEGDLAARVAEAMAAKHGLIFDLVRQSPFAAELFSAKDRHAAETFRDLDADIEKMLAEALGDKAKARLIFGGAMGVANHARDRAEMDRDIRHLVALICAEG